MSDNHFTPRGATGRKAGAAAELWPVWLAGVSLTLAGAFVAMKLDGAAGSVEPHRYERFLDSLQSSEAPN